MLKELTQNELGQLRQHLIVPLAVSDILYHNLAVEPEMQYSLHMALSEIDPDSALLAIALCAQDLADKCLIHAPIAAALQQEANNIVAEYGPTWLYHHKKRPMSSENFEKILQTVPEDLEALADLMDALCADLADQENSETSIASLLSIQARAHIEIAEYILREMEFEKSSQSDEGRSDEQPIMPQETINMDQYKESNVVLFPTHLRH